MKDTASRPSDARHRFPPAIIAHAVWLYCRFARSYRDVEALLAARGVVLTDEIVRQWCRKWFCCVVLGYAMWPSTRTAFHRHQRDIRTGE